MLALKLLLVPTFLFGLSIAGRVLGPSIAGWLAGLPVVAGPILLILALENGHAFAAQAAIASTAAVLASVSFSLAYAHAAQRLAWPFALLAGLAAWCVAALVLSILPSNLVAAAVLALLTLTAAPRLFPAAVASTAKPMGAAELGLRMATGAGLTLAVSQGAQVLGGTWSGLLAVFPVIGIVLAVFSHRSSGAAFAATLLRAMATGLYAFAAFCAVLAALLPSQSLAMSFGAAAVISVGVQAYTKGRLARRQITADGST
jgi:uncharacterized membrane protein (GlpM family)